VEVSKGVLTVLKTLETQLVKFSVKKHNPKFHFWGSGLRSIQIQFRLGKYNWRIQMQESWQDKQAQPVTTITICGKLAQLLSLSPVLQTEKQSGIGQAS
jgi:hypothetical protein